MNLRKAVLAVALSSLVLTSGLAAHADAQEASETMRQASAEDAVRALRTLNSFYKPALNGRFPGSVNGLKIRVNSRQVVIGKIAQPKKPRMNAGTFNVYRAGIWLPGYAIAYKLNRIREMRYFENQYRTANEYWRHNESIALRAVGHATDLWCSRKSPITAARVYFQYQHESRSSQPT